MSEAARENVRLDRWLWAARMFRSRTLAADACDGGKVHVNGGAGDQTSYTLDGFRISDPVTGRLEARMNGNKFKANTVIAIKLARAVYFMLKNKEAFNQKKFLGF